MSNRDELIEILHQEATADRVKNSPLRDVPVVAAKVESAADAILADGYRRPRVVTTVAELDALPFESLALMDGQIWINETPDVEGYRWRSITGIWDLRKSGEMFPATVLHEPEAEQ